MQLLDCSLLLLLQVSLFLLQVRLQLTNLCPVLLGLLQGHAVFIPLFFSQPTRTTAMMIFVMVVMVVVQWPSRG